MSCLETSKVGFEPLARVGQLPGIVEGATQAPHVMERVVLLHVDYEDVALLAHLEFDFARHRLLLARGLQLVRVQGFDLRIWGGLAYSEGERSPARIWDLSQFALGGKGHT